MKEKLKAKVKKQNKTKKHKNPIHTYHTNNTHLCVGIFNNIYIAGLAKLFYRFIVNVLAQIVFS